MVVLSGPPPHLGAALCDWCEMLSLATELALITGEYCVIRCMKGLGRSFSCTPTSKCNSQTQVPSRSKLSALAAWLSASSGWALHQEFQVLPGATLVSLQSRLYSVIMCVWSLLLQRRAQASLSWLMSRLGAENSVDVENHRIHQRVLDHEKWHWLG